RAPGWVRVAAVHTGLNLIRGDRRRERRHRLTSAPEAVAGPEDAVVERERHAELRRALARLPNRSATVLVLRHGGMSYAEGAGPASPPTRTPPPDCWAGPSRSPTSTTAGGTCVTG